MKRELRHYYIDKSYGGNQDWFSDLWMNRGGCGAVTACECCMSLAINHGLRDLVPFDPETVTKESFLDFAMRMKPYLRPRPKGINKTSLFMDGFRDYLATLPDTGLAMTSVEGCESTETAVDTIRRQLDAGFPVPYLMLLHRDKALEDFFWHWFVLTGYDEDEDGFLVKAVTYGEWIWLDLRHLWDTGEEEKGGFVVFSLP